MSGRLWLGAVLLAGLMGASPGRAAEALDLNRAQLAELQALPGIGPKKAEAIVALRQRRPFTRVTQLLEVRGIGRKTLERLKPLVQVGPPTAAAAPAPEAAKEAPGAAAPGLPPPG